MSDEKVLAIRREKTIYKSGNTVLKMFSNTYSKADILNEALNHARVEETNLPIPKILGVTMREGRWTMITEFIPGETLAQLMDKEPEKEHQYLNLFVDLQLKMHEKKAPMLNKLKDKMSRKIDESKLDATTRYDLHTRLEAMPRHNKVCHGDFNPSNIIIHPEGTAYILDWSHATQGNASADAARTYLLFCLEGKMELAEQYLHLFCKKSDTAKQYVQQWLPIVATSQSVKGKPEEREFLLRWVDVMDYQ